MIAVNPSYVRMTCSL